MFFAVPNRGGKWESLASQVNQQVQDEADPLVLPVQPSRSVSDPLRSLSKRVSAKLEGDYRGAVRAACSEDTIAVLFPDTISALQQKHPPAHPDSAIPPPSSDDPAASLTCSE